ncbi:MAG: metallophosphoesterase [Ruminococcus sp.]|nr:metallophosphoesterase [Ruminococcus sp.]
MGIKMFKKSKRKTITLIVLIVIIVVAIFAFDSRLKIQNYDIESDNITENIRIALITDLHSCKYGKDEIKLIEAIDSQKPDIILLGGDICDDVIPNDNTEALLKGITDKYPCYYVTGNHEYWSNDVDAILKLFESYNVTILNGNYVTTDIKGQKINICGISDPDVSNNDADIVVTEQLEMIKNAGENGNYTILLTHRPEYIDLYSKYDFDLVLAGHAHGGQFRIPFILNGLYAPNQGLFPEYAGGEYLKNNTKMIVSRGLARESTRVPRIFNRPELVIIELT